MPSIVEFFDREFAGNSLTRWALAIGVAIIVLTVTAIVRRVVRRHYAHLAQTERIEVMEVPLHVAARTTTSFLIAVSLFAGFLLLHTPGKFDKLARTVVTIAAFWQLGLWLSTAAIAWIEVKSRRSAGTDRSVVGTLSIIGVVVRGAIWSVALLLTLDNLGVNITTLVAGLGIGGVAIALAVQNVLGDLLASLSIALDKPFVVGDFLVVGDFMGSVEHIGIKSTRLRSLSGEQIAMSNADLLSSRVRNFGRMRDRRVQFNFSVTYETPRDHIEKINQRVSEIVRAQSKVKFDRCHFSKFGGGTLDFEVVYIVLSDDYNLYMDIQQRINLQILEALDQLHVDLAYPTQKTYMVQSPITAASPSGASNGKSLPN